MSQNKVPDISGEMLNLSLDRSKLMNHRSSSENTLSGSAAVLHHNSGIYYSSNNASVSTLTPTSVDTPDVESQQNIQGSRSQNIMIPQKTVENKKIKGADGEESPDLLATSVGVDGEGRLVPSSSNISLLSLNQQFAQATTSTTNITSGFHTNPALSSDTANNSVPLSWSTNISRNLTQQRLPLLQHQNSTSSVSQFPTLASISMAPSSQQQQHHRKFSLNSPTMQNQATFGAQYSIGRPTASRTNSTSRHTETQSIQIHNGMEPDSPSLNPTSLAGSPSNFYLNHSSPPGSLKSHNTSYINLNAPLSLTHSQTARASVKQQQQLLQLQLQEQQLAQLQGQNSIGGNSVNNANVQLIRVDSMTNSIGGRSPDFLPVSSTLPPMTPLNLSIPAELGNIGLSRLQTTPGTSSTGSVVSKSHSKISNEEAITDDDDDDNESVSRVDGNRDQDEDQDVFAQQIQDSDL